jgi:hypothetical protein
MFGLEIATIVFAMNPIVIDECHITNTRSYVSADRPIAVAFTNRRATPAEEIRFTVEYAGRTEHVVDKGTFSQNVRVDHAFRGFYNERYQAVPPSCTVDYVEFRDGSVWTATTPSPNQSAGPPARLSGIGRSNGWSVRIIHLADGGSLRVRYPRG